MGPNRYPEQPLEYWAGRAAALKERLDFLEQFGEGKSEFATTLRHNANVCEALGNPDMNHLGFSISLPRPFVALFMTIAEETGGDFGNAVAEAFRVYARAAVATRYLPAEQREVLAIGEDGEATFIPLTSRPTDQSDQPTDSSED